MQPWSVPRVESMARLCHVVPDPLRGWRVFGCPKSTYDLVSKVEDDIKELEAGGRLDERSPKKSRTCIADGTWNVGRKTEGKH